MVGQTNRGFGTLDQGKEAKAQNPGAGSVSGLGATVQGMVENVKDKAEDMASDALHRAEDLWDNTRQGVTRAASNVADTATDAFEGLTDYMRRYPIATLMVGFGLGFLAAQAFSRSRETWR